jgi:hypothetical protein
VDKDPAIGRNASEHAKLKELAADLLTKPEDPGEVHPCPVCGGHAHFRFTVFQRRSKPMVGIHAWCEYCGTEIAVDYLSPIPLWARSQ